MAMIVVMTENTVNSKRNDDFVEIVLDIVLKDLSNQSLVFKYTKLRLFRQTSYFIADILIIFNASDGLCTKIWRIIWSFAENKLLLQS